MAVITQLKYQEKVANGGNDSSNREYKNTGKYGHVCRLKGKVPVYELTEGSTR